MAFECNFDFLSPEQNEKFAAFVNEMREFADNGSSEFVRVSRELKVVSKERDNYRAMLKGASKGCEDLRREYKAFRDGVAAASGDLHKAGTLSADFERACAECEDLRERLKCANAEIARLREEASSREDSAASVEKMRGKYEKKIAVLEGRLRSYKDYRARVARMAAMAPDDEALNETFEAVLKEEGAL